MLDEPLESFTRLSFETVIAGSQQFIGLLVDVASFRADAPSHGALASDFLASDVPVSDYVVALKPRAGECYPFNLLLRDGPVLMEFESRVAPAFVVPAGIAVVFNADCDTPWPKLVLMKSALQSAQE